MRRGRYGTNQIQSAKHALSLLIGGVYGVRFRRGQANVLAVACGELLLSSDNN
jgi:hypothetical protein